ncbi:EamA family transporter [Dactylosporangium sp. AC04546]|uniref:EamA family transporter n=1 Tax=Dactylosporangium sp. AC04546 TaxID=2862460 RepID=UPI001EE048D9|nr:EamA family transporter [Dactylosporangium sp. AC04546]WVK88646.1 EamA family transporter [Dactylosporangium sp. AC04546]
MADTIAVEAPRDKGVGLVLASQTSVHSGAAVATMLFPIAGAAGVVTLRLVIGAALMLAVCRPKLRGHRAGDWALLAGFGVVLAVMNFLYYLAIERMPIGPVVTLEVLGPLTLSVLAGKGAARWLWALLALAGVALLGFGGLDAGGFDLIAAGLALAAGACWAGYILLSARTGSRFPKQDGLALAMTVAALVALPLGVTTSGGALFEPVTLALGAAVAVLSSVLPYSLELAALRRLPTGTFAVLMSLGPAIAALAGFAIAGQALSVAEIAAIVLVVAASAGAVRSRTVAE